MLDTQTKKRIDDCRDILVGKLPDPKAQIEQITIALIYKFMDDMDKEAAELGGKVKFFSDYSIPNPEFPDDRSKDNIIPFRKYSWDNLMNPRVTAAEMLRLYSEAIEGMEKNPNIPQLFRDIFKNAYLPYRDLETLKLFLKTIDEFEYSHSEKLGDAFEYLLSVMGSQGDAGQFRTPRHIIDFLVAIVNPDKNDTILDPACGTAGFLISAYKHILLKYSKDNVQTQNSEDNVQTRNSASQHHNIFIYNQLDQKPFNNLGNLLTPDDRRRLIENFEGYDISPDMVRLSLVNLYLHGFSNPSIVEYDTLSSEERWNENFDVILANPPFMSPKGGIRPHKKFSISSNRSEVLFVDYIAEHLNPGGKAGVIVPEGVIFQSGKAYKELRKMLVEEYLYAVVSLPAGVFNPYSGVKTSILLMEKTIAKEREDMLFIKIENDGYNLGAQRTPIKGSQLEEAIAIAHQYLAEADIPETEIAHLVPKAEIAKNGEYNLSGERYKENLEIRNQDYEFVKIGDVFKTASGGTPLRSKEEYYKNGTIPWLKSGEIAQGYIFHSEEFITKEGMNNSSAKLFPINSVLIAMYGATAGQVGILKFESTTNQAVCAIYPNKIIKPEYLYWILKHQTDNFIKLSTGGGQPNISQQIIRNFQIPLPPLSVQEEIVAEINAYQKIIDGAKAVVENYKPHIDIDPDWEMVELGKVCEVINGRAYKQEELLEKGKYKVLRVGNFFSNRSWYFSDLELDISKYCHKDDLLYAWSASFGPKIWNEDNTIYHYHIWKLIPNEDLISKLFLHYILYINTDKLKQEGGRGIAMIHLTKSGFEKTHIPIPPLSTQNSIVAKIEKEQALVDANKQLIEIFEQKIKDRIAKVWG